MMQDDDESSSGDFGFSGGAAAAANSATFPGSSANIPVGLPSITSKFDYDYVLDEIDRCRIKRIVGYLNQFYLLCEGVVGVAHDEEKRERHFDLILKICRSISNEVVQLYVHAGSLKEKLKDLVPWDYLEYLSQMLDHRLNQPEITSYQKVKIFESFSAVFLELKFAEPIYENAQQIAEDLKDIDICIKSQEFLEKLKCTYNFVLSGTQELKIDISQSIKKCIDILSNAKKEGRENTEEELKLLKSESKKIDENLYVVVLQKISCIFTTKQDVNLAVCNHIDKNIIDKIINIIEKSKKINSNSFEGKAALLFIVQSVGELIKKINNPQHKKSFYFRCLKELRDKVIAHICDNTTITGELITLLEGSDADIFIKIQRILDYYHQEITGTRTLDAFFVRFKDFFDEFNKIADINSVISIDSEFSRMAFEIESDVDKLTEQCRQYLRNSSLFEINEEELTDLLKDFKLKFNSLVSRLRGNRPFPRKKKIQENEIKDFKAIYNGLFDYLIINESHIRNAAGALKKTRGDTVSLDELTPEQKYVWKQLDLIRYFTEHLKSSTDKDLNDNGSDYIKLRSFYNQNPEKHYSCLFMLVAIGQAVRNLFTKNPAIPAKQVSKAASAQGLAPETLRKSASATCPALSSSVAELVKDKISDDVNIEYQYEDYDIEAILKVRLAQEITAPGELGDDGRIQVLAPVDGLSPGILEMQLRENRTLFGGARVVLIPYNVGHYHWIGMLLEFNSSNQIVRALHSDSLGQHDFAQLQKRLNLGGYQCTLQSIRLLEQPDSTSCGAYAIENLVLAATNRGVPDPTPSAKDIRSQHLACLQERRLAFYQGSNGFYERQLANRITAINQRFASGSGIAQKAVFSVIELRKILDITECIRQLVSQNLGEQLWEALKSKPSYDTNHKLHLDEIRRVMKVVVDSAVSEQASNDLLHLQKLTKILFGTEWAIDAPFTDELMDTFYVDYEQIIAIAKRKDVNATSTEQMEVQAAIAEQIRSDEEIARRLQQQPFSQEIFSSFAKADKLGAEKSSEYSFRKVSGVKPSTDAPHDTSLAGIAAKNDAHNGVLFFSVSGKELPYELEFIKWVRNSLAHATEAIQNVAEDGFIFDSFANDLLKLSIHVHGARRLEFSEHLSELLEGVKAAQKRIVNKEDVGSCDFYRFLLGNQMLKFYNFNDFELMKIVAPRLGIDFRDKKDLIKNLEPILLRNKGSLSITTLLKEEASIKELGKGCNVSDIRLFGKIARGSSILELDYSGLLVEFSGDKGYLKNLADFKNELQSLLGFRIKIVTRHQMDEYLSCNLHNSIDPLTEKISSFDGIRFAYELYEKLNKEEYIGVQELIRKTEKDSLNLDFIIDHADPFLHRLIHLYSLCGNQHNDEQQVIFDTLQLIIESGSDINMRDENGNAPIHLAVGNSVILELLLKNKADPNLLDDNSLNALHLAVDRSSYARVDLKDVIWSIEVLLKYGVQTYTAYNRHGKILPLHWVLDNGYPKLALNMLDNVRDKSVFSDYGKYSMTPLHLALESFFKKDSVAITDKALYRQVIIKLINEGVALNHKASWTPLQITTRFRDFELVDLLIERGANPNFKELLDSLLYYDEPDIKKLVDDNLYKDSPAYEIAIYLINKGAKISSEKIEKYSRDMTDSKFRGFLNDYRKMLLAVKAGNLEKLNEAKNAGVSLNIVDSLGNSLLVLALLDGRTEVIKYLLEEKIVFNPSIIVYIENKYGLHRVPVYRTLRHFTSEVLCLLNDRNLLKWDEIDSDVLENITTNVIKQKKFSLLNLMASLGVLNIKLELIDCLRTLLPRLYLYYLVYKAIESDYLTSFVYCVSKFKENNSIFMFAFEGQSILHIAIKNNAKNIVNYILEKKLITGLSTMEIDDFIPEDDEDIDDNTFEIVKSLIDNGLNIDLADSTGMTILHRAVKYRRINELKMLLKLRVIEVNKYDNLGRTALHIAISEDKSGEALRILSEDSAIDINANRVIIMFSIFTGEVISPLFYACNSDNYEAIKILFRHKDIRVDKDLGLVLLYALKHNDTDFLAEILSKPGLTIDDTKLYEFTNTDVHSNHLQLSDYMAMKESLDTNQKKIPLTMYNILGECIEKKIRSSGIVADPVLRQFSLSRTQRTKGNSVIDATLSTTGASLPSKR